jgi:AraC-like DNA-binding protein
VEGKFEWQIGEKDVCISSGDIVIVLPGQQFGSRKGFLELGKVCRIFLSPGVDSSFTQGEHFENGSTGNFSVKYIKQILAAIKYPVISDADEVGRIFKKIEVEYLAGEMFYNHRISQLAVDLLIILARTICRKKQPCASVVFNIDILNQALLKNLAFNWTLNQMAAVTGHGTTSFTEKVKLTTGFSPFNYLIYLRVNEAVKLIQNSKMKITEIALYTGFYSSQHFAGIFKKFTGYTPSEMRSVAVNLTH